MRRGVTEAGAGAAGVLGVTDAGAAGVRGVLAAVRGVFGGIGFDIDPKEEEGAAGVLGVIGTGFVAGVLGVETERVREEDNDAELLGAAAGVRGVVLAELVPGRDDIDGADGFEGVEDDKEGRERDGRIGCRRGEMEEVAAVFGGDERGRVADAAI